MVTTAPNQSHETGRMGKSRRACEACHRNKSKCVYEDGQQRCKRCARLDRECVPHVSRQGKRPPKPDRGKIEEEALGIIERGAKLYYAVRVGYAMPRLKSNNVDDDSEEGGYDIEGKDNVTWVGPPPRVLGKSNNNEDDEDGQKNVGRELPAQSTNSTNKRRKIDSTSSASSNNNVEPVRVRSAIFLRRDDASQFFDSVRGSRDYKAEYGAFDTLERAEAYLLEGEERRWARSA